jgi:hypothetical protein
MAGLGPVDRPCRCACIVVRRTAVGLVEDKDVKKLVGTSVRFSPGTLDRLKTLAHLRSLETRRTVTWNGLVRDCVERHLLGGESSGAGAGTPAAAGR